MCYDYYRKKHPLHIRRQLAPADHRFGCFFYLMKPSTMADDLGNWTSLPSAGCVAFLFVLGKTLELFAYVGYN